MINNLSFPLLVIIFLAAAILTWIAGVTLTKATDTLDTRFKIGDALGGLILLGIAGSLPEIAVVFSAARAGHIPVIIGNLIGGLSIQTLVIILFDFAVKAKKPLSYLAGSLLMSIETIFAIILTMITILGMLIPPQVTLFHLNPFSILIIIAWIGGLFIINRERKIQRFNLTSADASPGRKHRERRVAQNHHFYAKKSNGFVVGIFLITAVMILIAGFFLERSGTLLAERLNIGMGIFAATAIAFVTALPEISTGLESVFIGDNQLAISDIMGGNAFMLSLFLFADIVAQKPVLSLAGHQDLILSLLAIMMMTIYAISFLFRPKHRYFRLGFDSILVIIIYLIGLYILSLI